MRTTSSTATRSIYWPFFTLGFLAALAAPFAILALKESISNVDGESLLDLGLISAIFALPALAAGLATAVAVVAGRFGWGWTSVLAASVTASFVVSLPMFGT